MNNENNGATNVFGGNDSFGNLNSTNILNPHLVMCIYFNLLKQHHPIFIHILCMICFSFFDFYLSVITILIYHWVLLFFHLHLLADFAENRWQFMVKITEKKCKDIKSDLMLYGMLCFSIVFFAFWFWFCEWWYQYSLQGNWHSIYASSFLSDTIVDFFN